MAPQVAAPLAGDCTFEVDDCGWTSGQGSKGRDRIEWQRLPVRTQNIRYQRRPSTNTQIGSNENGKVKFQSNPHSTICTAQPALYNLQSCSTINVSVTGVRMVQTLTICTLVLGAFYEVKEKRGDQVHLSCLSVPLDPSINE